MPPRSLARGPARGPARVKRSGNPVASEPSQERILKPRSPKIAEAVAMLHESLRLCMFCTQYVLMCSKFDIDDTIKRVLLGTLLRELVHKCGKNGLRLPCGLSQCL